VAGEIVLAQVRLSFHDDSAGSSIVGVALEDGAQHFARDNLRLALVKTA
jgi:hypothetical protein